MYQTTYPAIVQAFQTLTLVDGDEWTTTLVNLVDRFGADAVDSATSTLADDGDLEFAWEIRGALAALEFEAETASRTGNPWDTMNAEIVSLRRTILGALLNEAGDPYDSDARLGWDAIGRR